MNKQGISKVELLIVVAIIGLLGIMAVVAVSSARSRTRDAVRLSDIRQMQTSLELYFHNTNAYPDGSALALGSAAANCLGDGGFASTCYADEGTIYAEVIPTSPTDGLDGTVVCDAVKDVYCYYGNEEAYRIEFELEHDNPLIELVKGVNCATESGLEAGACSAISTLTEADEVTEEGDQNEATEE